MSCARRAGPNSSQTDLFNSVKDIALSVLDMNNVCIFAYGSTGSGKTFSMQGPPGVLDGTASAAEFGLYPRILDAMFERIAHLTSREVGEYELYMRIADNYLKGACVVSRRCAAFAQSLPFRIVSAFCRPSSFM